ncbi:hypothetical protein RDABS01_037596, partial [Bienertia sinuspersici]
VLNSDGAARGTPGIAGGGGIIRDNRGLFQRAFSANFGVCSAYKAELKAVAIGLDMAHGMAIKKLVIQMDNKACIEVLNNPDYQGGECFHIINHCRKLLALNSWEVKLTHCYREGNRVADKLANIGVAQSDLLIFHQSPPTSPPA